MAKPDYRFRFQIVNQTNGDVAESDWVTINDVRIGEFGDCEPVDMAVGKMLRNWRTFARAEYEAKNDPKQECDCCGQLVASLSRCWVTGIETFACDECRGVPA
jgi:hypothetical protein